MIKADTIRSKRPAEGLIALLTVLFAVFLFGPLLINAPKVDPTHPFDTQATFERLSRILGDEAPHPVDSDASDAVINRLIEEIEALGFDPIVDDAFHCGDRWNIACARVRNIGFWVTEPGPNAVMVASHHDSVPTGPGAADDMMGVASSLEIARLMRGRDLPRPLYILITDAEEIGLVGAARFVSNDPVAPFITAVVSLEARGNRGAASMFETSDPNSRDLKALTSSPDRRVRGPVSNSLSVDIYRAMPNGTDVTEYLTLGMDAANYAMTGHYSHYHTRHDSLANLSENAVFHIGASALSAVEGFMEVDATTSESSKIYGDVLGMFILSLPQSWGLPLIILTLLASMAALFRSGQNQDAGQTAPLWRVLLLPILVLIGGTGAAMLASILVDAVRPESAYGTAYPIALRGLFLSLALGVGILAARWLYRPDGANRYLAGSWTVLMLLGVGATLAFSGAMVLFALPALLGLPAALLMIARRLTAARIIYALAAILTLTQLLSLHVGAETALFVETSAPLSALALWIFLIAIPLVWTQAGSVRRPAIGAGLAVLGFGLAALLVPAYSAKAPLGTNLYHLSDAGQEEAHLVLTARNPLPDSLMEIAPFDKGEIDKFSTNLWVTSVAPPNLSPATLIVRSNRLDGDQRILSLRIEAADADRVQLLAPDDAPQVERLTLNGYTLPQTDSPFRNIECNGRACRALDVEMVLKDTPGPYTLPVWISAWGMGPIGEPFDAARPDWTGPQHDGDRRIVRSQFVIRAPEDSLTE